jgi:PAS domain S-box-containing protein
MVRLRIRNTVAIPIVLLLLSLTLGVLVSGYYVNKRVFRDVFEERERNRAKGIHLTIESLVSREEKRVSDFASVLKKDTDLNYGLYHYAQTKGDLKPLASAMTQLHAQMDLDYFRMADGEGKILYDGSRRTTGGEAEEDPESFRLALDGKEHRYVSRGGGGWILRSVTPIYVSGWSKPTGILVLGTAIDNAFARRIAGETGSQVFLAGPGGFLAGSYVLPDPRGIRPDLVSRALSGGGAVFRIDDRSYRSYTYVPLDVAGEKFCLVIESDISVIKELLSRNRGKMVEWGLVLVLAVSLLGAVLTFWFIRPLGRLRGEARALVREYTGGELPEERGGNEITTLIRAIRLMVEAIKDHISERTRVEEALLETSRALEALIEASPLAIVVSDGGGRIRVWNPAASRIFGWGEEEAIGRANPLAAAPENGEICALFRTVPDAGDVREREVLCRDREGNAIVASVYRAAMLDAGGVVIGVAAIVADVTEARRAEEALRDSEEQLRQAQKMEAVGKLAGGVAHDFNNLLSVINGYSELLLMRLDSGAAGYREIEEIHKAGDRGASLTHQLLAFSRRQVLKPVVLSLNESVSNLGKMLRRLIRANIRLETDLAPDLPPVEADPHQVDQILMNLTVNARDAMPGGGVLSFATGALRLDRPLSEGGHSVPAGDWVTLEVRDTGTGMDEATLARIFEPFFTTKGEGKGTGLGLSTVYGIVTQSGGHILVRSRPGDGTSFRIFLPRADAGEVQKERRLPAAGPAVRLGDGAVLVVEDEDSVRAMICETLREHGTKVLEARRGVEALAVASLHDGPIRLLVTDVVMEGMTGLQLAKELKKSRPETEVLYISGYAEESVRRLGVSASEMAFLEKPITPTSLFARLAEMFPD